MTDTPTERGAHTECKLELNEDMGDLVIEDSAGYVICRCKSGEATRQRLLTPKRVEALNRIVDCVNGCEGLNPASVPDLVAALREYLNMDDDLIGGMPRTERHQEADKAARTALDKATK